MSAGPLDLYVAIGGDRYVAHSEAALDATPHGRRVWEVYDRHFGRFTGAGLDPLFRRLRHGDRRLSLPRVDPASTMLVVADGALDASRLVPLLRHRDRLMVAATATSEQTLRAHGLHADLVLIESDPDESMPATVALDPRTTYLMARSAALAGAVPDAVRIAPILPTWGLPAATLAALALQAGAGAVIITGSESSGQAGAEGREAALVALLDLLALEAPGRLVMLDGEPALRAASPSPGWKRAWTPEDLMPASARLTWVDHGPATRFVDQARADLARIATIVRDAGRALDAALRARDGEGPDRGVLRAVETVLAWGADPCLRWSMQQGLGLGFLPRLWRSGISIDPSTRQWRPVILALQELIEQTGRLVELLEAAPSARPPRPLRPRHATASGRSATTRVSAIVLAMDSRIDGLRDAVRSLTAQTHTDLEVLIVHDVTASAAIAAAIADGDARVRCVEVDGASMAEALNQAIAAAAGELMVHHDADGVSHPERLARQLAYLRRHPDIDVVATATVTLDGADERAPLVGASRAHQPDAHTHAALARLFADGCPIAHGSVMLRRDAVLRAGGYPPADEATPSDLGLWRRLLTGSRFASLPTQLYARRGSLAGSAALIPARARDWHAPAGPEGAIADPQTGRGLPALELGEPHEA